MTRLTGAAVLAMALTGCGGASNIDGWTIELTGDTGAVTLPDMKGTRLTLRKFGSEVHMDAVGSELGRVVLGVPVGYDGPHEDDYKPSLFNVRWSNSEYACVNNENSVVVTFYGTDPARGRWKGELICNAPDGNDDTAFVVGFDGYFKRTH